MNKKGGVVHMEYIQAERAGLGRHRGGHSSWLLLKITQHITSLEVYTPPLNVDYVPVLKELKLPELIEFAPHLVISVLLSILLAIFLKSKNWPRGRSLSWFLGLSGRRTSPVSDYRLSKRTPELTDLAALLFWLAGHLLYGITLGWSLTGSCKASA